jgi:hypothetical protein
MSEQIIFITLPTLCIAALSSYTAYYSYVSITDVQMYEDQTKKVAEYSNIAEDALTQTRTTEGAGAFAVSLIHCAMVVPMLLVGCECVKYMLDHARASRIHSSTALLRSR